MYPLPKTRPISDFRKHQSEILDLVDTSGPVLLTQHGADRAVVLSLEDYNFMVQRLHQYSDIDVLQQRIREMETDESSYVTLEELDAELSARGLLDVAN